MAAYWPFFAHLCYMLTRPALIALSLKYVIQSHSKMTLSCTVVIGVFQCETDNCRLNNICDNAVIVHHDT